MIGISPRGVVTHVSSTYGGCTSDRQIIERSELVQKGMFEKGDSIMADRGIMVQDMFASLDVKVNTPTMLKRYTCFSAFLFLWHGQTYFLSGYCIVFASELQQFTSVWQCMVCNGIDRSSSVEERHLTQKNQNQIQFPQ